MGRLDRLFAPCSIAVVGVSEDPNRPRWRWWASCGAMLHGFRGMPAVDIGALAEILARLSWFAWENRETVAAVDINPLIATAQGVVAADALIVRR